MDEWRFEIDGMVEQPVSWSWSEFTSLPADEIAQPLAPSNISSHQPSRIEQLRAPLRAAFSPLVPLASIGRRGVLSHTSLPW